jgi:type IV secretory pathway VirB2 component (pilin)
MSKLAFSLRLALLVGMALWPSALAQVQDAVAPLTAFMCSLFATLSGPFGIALSMVVLAAGMLMWAVGARGAMSRVGQGVVAVAALVTLPALFQAMFPAAAGNMCPA